MTSQAAPITAQTNNKLSMFRSDIPLQDTGSRHDTLPKWRRDQWRGVTPYRERVRELARIAESDTELRQMWRQLRDWFSPESGRYLYTSFCHGVVARYSSNESPEVQRSRRRIVNSVSTGIINTCAAGIRYAFTSAQKPWFLFSPSDKKLVENIEARMWLDATRDTVRDAMAESNFYTEMDRVYYESSIFGVGVAVSEPDKERKLNYQALTIGEFVLDENAAGVADTCYIRMEMTAKQIADKFGKDNKGLTEEVRTALSHAGGLSMKFVVFRAIQPINAFGDAPAEVEADWKFESVYFIDGADKAHEQEGVLRCDWHRTCPFIAVRWKRTGRHVYGTSPGKDCLADQKMLQRMTTGGINAMEMEYDPPKIAGEAIYDAIQRAGRVSPGSVFKDDPTMPRERQVLQAAYLVRPNFVAYDAMMQGVIQRIKDAFFFDQWRAIVNVERQMTAFEVDARLNEKNSLLAPVVESFSSQLFTPILERAYSICLYDLGIIYPPPDSMGDQEFRVEYEGDYAKGIKQVEVERIQMFIRATVEAAAGIAGMHPEAAKDMLNQINFGGATRFISTRYDVSPEVMHNEAEVDEAKQRDQQAAQAQAEAVQMQGMVDMAQKMGNTPTTPGNALADMTGGGGVPSGQA